MNIVTDTAFAFTSLPNVHVPGAQSPKSLSENQLPLAGPGLAGGGATGLPLSSSVTQPLAPDNRPLIDRAMEIAKEVIQSVVNQLFEILRSGVAQLVESMLATKQTAESQGAIANTTASAAESSPPAPTTEQIGSWIDGAATAANLFVLGRGALGIATKIKRSIANGAKAAASVLDKATVAPDLLRTLGSRIRSALT